MCRNRLFAAIVVRHIDLRDLRGVRDPQALSSALSALGMLQLAQGLQVSKSFRSLNPRRFLCLVV